MSDIESRGLPTAMVATVEFVSGKLAQEKSLGYDLAAVFTEHPIQDRTDEEMVQIADKAFEELVAALVD